MCKKGVQEFIETSRDLKSNNAENEYLKGLDEKIDALEKRAIGSELGTAMFVVSAQMLLKFGIGTVALVGGTMLIGGNLTLMQFFCFLLVASRLYEPMSGTLINLAAINALQINVDRMNEINNTKEQEGSTSFVPKGYDIVFDHAGFSYEDVRAVVSGNKCQPLYLVDGCRRDSHPPIEPGTGLQPHRRTHGHVYRHGICTEQDESDDNRRTCHFARHTV